MICKKKGMFYNMKNDCTNKKSTFTHIYERYLHKKDLRQPCFAHIAQKK